MSTYNFIPKVFDARYHGATTYSECLAYHKQHDSNMPIDGIIWACEHNNTNKLKEYRNRLILSIQELESSMKGLSYNSWTCLDRFAQFSRARLQLINMYFESANYKQIGTAKNH